ncbi:D-alanine--D-alanine ligase [Acinetobacter sp. neg1]|uniref:D-alanine--D-alanine ligase n=1 Tax=Acinetobacter TaxID=469 RepID=UPI000541C91D|nr:MULTISPECIES: D-alanine--D-alanine ligase [Acinetobacter]KHF77181.1 D-alanine--D-alanine ligase [Acinetobacter sp. neg1]MBJ8482872.1 D-alanine--D-alanine ligase [Acinetobacter vivianii]
MQKKNVGIIFGGKSTEHEVSLQSAKNIVDAIDKDKFNVTLIGIDKNGIWHLNESTHFLLNSDNPSLISLHQSGRNIAFIPGKNEEQIIEFQDKTLSQLDVIFPIVHGTLGEDGSLQGLLKMVNLPFVGSQVLSSAMCMDKDITKRLLRDAGLNITPFIKLAKKNRKNISFEIASSQLGCPLFVKPANQGSSVGVNKVTSPEEFEAALEMAFTYDNKVLIEQGIDGREIECAVIGNDEPSASVCGEIELEDSFYSYDTKYINDKGATVTIPANIPDQISEKIREISIKAYEVLECTGLARVDVFLTKNGEIFINEINTLPGFTNISMFPKLWEVSGLNYSDLITRLIELAIEHHENDAQLKNTVSLDKRV